MSDSADRDERTALAARAATAGSTVARDLFRTGVDVETKDGKTDVVTRADREAQRRVIDVLREEFPDDAVVGEEEDELKRVPDEGAAWIVDPVDGTSNFVRSIRIWATAVAATVDGDPVAGAIAAPALGDLYVGGADGTARRVRHPRQADDGWGGRNEDGDRLGGDAHREADDRAEATPLAVSEETDPERATVTPTFWWDFDRRDEYAAALAASVERFGDVRRFGCAQLTLAMVAEGALEGAFTNLRANPWDTVAGVHLVRLAGGTVTDLAGEPWRHDSTGLVVSNGALHGEVLAAARAAEGLDD